MQEKLEKLVNSKFEGVTVWEYSEYSGTCYLRFTSANAVYIASIQKAGSHATIFKAEGSFLI